MLASHIVTIDDSMGDLNKTNSQTFEKVNIMIEE